MRRRHTHRGFTLIELVVTLALLGVLAMLAAPLAETAVQRSREQALRASLREIRDAIDSYRAAALQGRIVRNLGESGYPPSLAVLVSGVADAQDPKGGRLYFLRRLPRDPFFADARADAQATWGLRSYASPPDEPRDGDDVYDVYSTATGIALDGTPYREW
ncbi:MAG TPA: type II secretion system protein [Piscinibacter sp.]|jgi:general secretion pathway protein G|uniref:type II secretion system protein n=1 Tax=Piscinibacter sp. TaxID=1903157 RepID=UPI001B6DA32E|nr:type II secretion system protein [Piscinibacter sp.]MBK7532422.1 type II secretion system protein [Piscinibacter sp.]MBP6543076.1 type II secretion system protein [Piscinibacter sp.]HOY34441.1 type II secretion system protein [Piscinibacter sp.]HPG77182.1 type II secretion system protein [Piscinibacter sp.]HPM64760.1 type II secretion system protein [Piscinibacter sp.]